MAYVQYTSSTGRMQRILVDDIAWTSTFPQQSTSAQVMKTEMNRNKEMHLREQELLRNITAWQDHVVRMQAVFGSDSVTGREAAAQAAQAIKRNKQRLEELRGKKEPDICDIIAQESE